ncbi:hypothetical protein DSL72_008549 [Monilinia vaccinii-corymbosi]|uniref:Uncharacterized protein n=1 Tax=Monilinia vaccinii-corymbosi TaxID=61207 RepID=A0A8A3PR20_9HELO|nr:hypothetical protein DSL72_008549 [Monilinia vaccinii-corymbosi]
MGNPNCRSQLELFLTPKDMEVKKLAKQKLWAYKEALWELQKAFWEYQKVLWEEEKASWEKQEVSWETQALEMKAAREKYLTDKTATKENTKKAAATMEFENIQKHNNLTLKQKGDSIQLVIDLNFIADPPTDMMAMIKILSAYSLAITNVQIDLLAPIKHASLAIYKQRVQSMNQLMEQLSSFPITVLNISVDIDDHDCFGQLKLAAAANGLVFQDWTMEYRVCGGETFFPIKRNSTYSKRLRGVYQAEFGVM